MSVGFGIELYPVRRPDLAWAWLAAVATTLPRVPGVVTISRGELCKALGWPVPRTERDHEAREVLRCPRSRFGEPV